MVVWNSPDFLIIDLGDLMKIRIRFISCSFTVS